MKFAKEMMKAKKTLEGNNHVVDIPVGTEKYAVGKLKTENQAESLANKLAHNAIREHYNKIVESDAILVINKDKNGINNYVGGNAFLEIGYAYVLNKNIFLLNPIPNMIYSTEIEAMKPIILNGDLSKIR